MMQKINFPLFLTLIRLCSAPILVPFFIVNYQHNIYVALFFLLLGLTDFFDGFFARKYSNETKIGKFLDPVADKFLVFSGIVGLFAIQKIYYVWVIILLGRELFITTLREISCAYQTSVPVSMYGKIKTFFHIIFIAWVIMNPYQSVGYAHWYNVVETFLLSVSVISSLWSAVLYTKVLYNNL